VPRSATPAGFAGAALATAACVVYLRPLHSGANYDEGVYLASLRELKHGATVGGTLFTSQPPGFYWFLRLLGLAGDSLTTFRVLTVVLALSACVAAFVLGRQLGGTAAGFGAGALLAIAPPWPVESSRLEADAPATAIAIAALAFAPRFPFAAGALLAAAVSIKLLAVAAVVPLALLLRRRFLSAIAGAALTALAILAPTVHHLAGVWHDTVSFHLHARNTDAPGLGANLHRIVHFLDPHTPFGLLTIAAILVAVALALTRAPQPWWPLWTFPPAAALVLAVQHPLLDHHMVLLAAAWALPAGVTLGNAATLLPRRLAWAAAAAGAIAFAAGLTQQWRQLTPDPTPPDVTAAVLALERQTPAGSRVAADLPIVPYLAGRRQPPDLVDTSAVRVESGDLSRADVLRDARGTSAFVLGRELATDDRLLAALEQRYARRMRIGEITVFVQPR
jgi:hypothetical protein